MSRIGKLPIILPVGVEVSLGTQQDLTIKGPRGTLTLFLPKDLTLQVGEKAMTLKPSAPLAKSSAFWGLYQVLLRNMVVGVTEGYRQDLEVVGVGYRAQSQGSDKIILNLGYSHPVEFNAPAGISFEVAENKITVLGIDKQLVGQTAAKIRATRQPEPYKGKGIRYLGEEVRRKAGKSAKVGG